MSSTDRNSQSTRSPYVIINETDAPQPSMVCQWVPGVGYCYLERRGTKPTFDGMQGVEATSIEAFGFVWAHNADGTVSFYLADDPPGAATATYQDGTPRKWQSRLQSFEYRQLKAGAVNVERV